LQGDTKLLGEFFGFDAALFAHGLQDGELSGIEGHCGLFFCVFVGSSASRVDRIDFWFFIDTIKKESF
jgi:hypothetical protein